MDTDSYKVMHDFCFGDFERWISETMKEKNISRQEAIDLQISIQKKAAKIAEKIIDEQISKYQ